mgnify:CR=1 FL=1
MDKIFSLIKDYSLYITIGLAALTFLLLIATLILTISVNKMQKRYHKMMRGVTNKSLEELIVSNLDRIEESANNSKEALELCQQYEGKINKCVNKVAIMRYKAFADVGSDLSFSIAILDSYNDGVILTGIYSRHDSTTYAKPVDKGISRYDLSEEEQHVLNEAINQEVSEIEE